MTDLPPVTIYPGRTVLDHFGFIEPYQPVTDYWCALPVRLVNTEGGGNGMELGPYSLNHNDIERLREAIAAYDLAVGG